jgi:prepilin-type N-terminal cleavage/methylation domain-containing protein
MRRGFTLIELMVTMAIMATLTAAMAYVMAGAQEAAQIAKTRTLVARLHTLVMQKYESYRYRRLPISIPPGLKPVEAAGIRCNAIRQLMRLEMPERWSDIYDPPVPLTTSTGVTIQPPPPTPWQSYSAFYSSVKNGPNFSASKDQSAKCLYLLIAMGLDEPDVMENFSEGDIADVDGSGCKVFLDAWGHPIHFLRWAPGFVSPLQPAQPGTNGIPATARDQRSPDQTDPTGFYGVPKTSTSPPGKANTSALYPLIYSSGPDGFDDVITEPPKGNFRYAMPASPPANNPFASLTDPAFTDGPIGATASATSLGRAPGVSDNIHNHLIGGR